MDTRKQPWWRAALAWWPFAALCVLGSTRWLIADRWPAASATLASSSAGCALAAACFLAAAALLRARDRSEDRTVPNGSPLSDALGGMLLVGGPAIGLVLLPRGLDSSSLMIALAMTPVVAGVTCVAVGDQCESLAGHLWPGLTALAGILLVLPEPSLADPAADIAMGLAPMMTGVGAVLLARRRVNAEPGGMRSTWNVTAMRFVTALSAAALFFGVFAVARSGLADARASLSPQAAVLDGAMAALAIECVRRLGAMRFAAEFAFVPLVVLVEGLVLMRPTLTLRTEIGLALLLVAGVVLASRREGSLPADTTALDLS